MQGYRMRLLYEIAQYPRSIFLTLTFDEPSLARFRSNPNRALSLFMDRMRKTIGYAPRHWFVAEFGKKHGRLHYHGFLFDCVLSNQQVESLWKYGNTWVGYANEVTARYIVKYLTKTDTKGERPPRIFSSHGIGDAYLTTPDCELARSMYATSFTINGYVVPIPRYYLDKMYNDVEKEYIAYYNHMEREKVYTFHGRRYSNERLLRHARELVRASYLTNGLLSHDPPSRVPRVHALERFEIGLNSFNQYGKNRLLENVIIRDFPDDDYCPF